MTDKFSHLPGPIAGAYREWETRAIEACRNDPKVKAANLCPACMASLPDCLCVLKRHGGLLTGEETMIVTAVPWWVPLVVVLVVGIIMLVYLERG